MASFEKLQELWQGQAGPAVSAADTLRLTRSLRDYGRRQNYINTAKALLVAAMMVWWLGRAHVPARAIAGFGLIGLAAAAVVIRDWRTQRAIARLDFSAPSLGFVQAAIHRLMQQRDPCRRIYWPFMASLVAGMNLALAPTHRWWLRAVASGLPFAAFELGMWVRRRRFDLECRPLLDQLAAMRSALEERFE
jgi:hypothetical protein